MEDLSQMLFKRQCCIHLWGNPDNKFVLHPRKEYDFFVIAIGRNFRKKNINNEHGEALKQVDDPYGPPFQPKPFYDSKIL